MSTSKNLVLATALVSVAVVLAGTCPPAFAQTCTVPGTHATIQAAVDDPGCATVALAAQTYGESIVIRRSLTFVGPGSGGAGVQGLVLIAGATTEVALQDLRVENGCRPDALRTSGGARLIGLNLQVERDDALPCPTTADAIFTDGFETGNTSAWSGTAP